MAAGVDMIEGTATPLAAGVRAKGEYRCSTCAYAVTVYRELPQCPMCGSDSWQQLDWSPFRRAAELVAPGYARRPARRASR